MLDELEDPMTVASSLAEDQKLIRIDVVPAQKERDGSEKTITVTLDEQEYEEAEKAEDEKDEESEEDTTEAKKKKSAKSEEPAEEADEAEEETTEKSQKKNKSEKIPVPDFLDPDAADDADSDAE